METLIKGILIKQIEKLKYKEWLPYEGNEFEIHNEALDKVIEVIRSFEL